MRRSRAIMNKRHGTVSLLAGIDLRTGKVHALVKDRHRSREFIAFLKLLDTVYPVDTAIHLILDNHSAHIARETRAWLAEQPESRVNFAAAAGVENFCSPRAPGAACTSLSTASLRTGSE
jgi:transposase